MNITKGDKNKILNQGAEVDFNLMVPMPETIKNSESSSRSEQWMYVYLSDKFTKSPDEVKKDPRSITIHNMFNEEWLEEVGRRAKKEFDTPEKIDEAYKQGHKYITNYEQYGSADWYDWSCRNWGTKWNASDTCISRDEADDLEVHFTTAWNPPYYWFDALMFEGYDFVDDWDEEGGMAGHYRVKNGEVKSNQVFSYSFQNTDDDSPIVEFTPYDNKKPTYAEYCPLVFY
jgi:hypothetical protein